MFHTQTKHRHIKLNNIEIIDDPVIKQALVNQECMNIIDKLIKIEKLHSTLPFTRWDNAFRNRLKPRTSLLNY